MSQWGAVASPGNRWVAAAGGVMERLHPLGVPRVRRMLLVEEAAGTRDEGKPHPHDLVLVVVSVMSSLLIVRALPCVTARWKRWRERCDQRGLGLAGSQPWKLCPTSLPSVGHPAVPCSLTSGGHLRPGGGKETSGGQPPTVWISPVTAEVSTADGHPRCPLPKGTPLPAFNPPASDSKDLLPLPLADLPLSAAVSPLPVPLGARFPATPSEPAVFDLGQPGDPGVKLPCIPGGRRCLLEWDALDRTRQGCPVSDSSLGTLGVPGSWSSSATLVEGAVGPVIPPQSVPANGEQVPTARRTPSSQQTLCPEERQEGPTCWNGVPSLMLRAAKPSRWSIRGLSSGPRANPGAGKQDRLCPSVARGDRPLDPSHFPSSPRLPGRPQVEDPSPRSCWSPQQQPPARSSLFLPGCSLGLSSPLQNQEPPDEFVEIALDEAFPANPKRLPESRAWTEPLLEFWSKLLPTSILNCFRQAHEIQGPGGKSQAKTHSDTPRVWVEPGTRGLGAGDLWGRVLTLSCSEHTPLPWGKSFTDLLFQELFKPTTVTKEGQTVTPRGLEADGESDPGFLSININTDPVMTPGSGADLGQPGEADGPSRKTIQPIKSALPFNHG
ncbi:uncharacterized protein LOC127586949 [Pristis pectinata]|uniref:uncharacterized protein LOC127586949 n=1 Tax=Pristis pectinata TaxID=685728 RepID=UPI00223D0B86|nr:uncharacterized protein LOC127586949 [Pristis pectinata]